MEKKCTVKGCKKPYRAKGYCATHYKKWRHGELAKTRYKICSNEECKVKTFAHGLCEKHYGEWKKTTQGSRGKAVIATEQATA